MCFEIREDSVMGIKYKEQKEKSSVSSVEANPCSEIFLSEEPTPCTLPAPDPCIELKLSLRQARSVASALDLFVHLGIGDMQFLKNVIDDGTIKKRVETNGLAEPLDFDETEELPFENPDLVAKHYAQPTLLKCSAESPHYHQSETQHLG